MSRAGSSGWFRSAVEDDDVRAPQLRMTSRGLALLAACLALHAVKARADAQSVQRRGGLPDVPGTVSIADDNGVTVIAHDGGSIVIPWDRVRGVVDQQPPTEFARHWNDAVLLWRARSRVERGDTALAEPIFERLFERYRGHTHETALVVAEGLLRCRLVRGQQAMALLPALEAARLRRAGIETVSYRHLPPVMDSATWLCPSLPPYWIDSPLTERARVELHAYDSQGDALVADLAAIYAMSLAAGSTGDDAGSEAEGENGATDDGVSLLRAAADAMSPDVATRRSARDRLRAAEPRLPVEFRAWARFFAGVALLAESGAVQRQRGAMSLLHVSALWGDEQPFLAGAALRLAADEMRAQRRDAAADSLLDELAARYPYHPIRGVRTPRVPVPPKETE
jgi:hypothetical protein